MGKGFQVGRGALFVGTLLFAGCSSLDSPTGSHQYVLNHDAYVSGKNESAAFHKRGDTFSIEDERLPLFVQAPERVPLMILPSHEYADKIEVALKPAEACKANFIEQEASRLLEMILPEINEVQALFSTRQATKALEKIEILERRFPQVRSLEFLRVSGLILMGDRDRAKAVLETALHGSPTNPTGRALYKILFGKEYSSISALGTKTANSNEESEP